MENLAAIPETHFTAWESLFECLRLKKNEKILDDGKLFGKISIDKVLDLVGAKILLDSLKIVKPSENAFVCCTGILGGEYFF